MAKVRSVMAVGGVNGGDPKDPLSKVAKNGKINKEDVLSVTDKDYKGPNRTKKVVLVQGGVTDGKTGKASTYVYEKLPTDKDFDVKKHRETVYNENLSALRKTSEYQEYRKGLSKGK